MLGKAGARMMIKKFCKLILALLLAVLAAAIGLVGYLSLTEYMPEEIEPVAISMAAWQKEPTVGSRLTAVTWNIGYAGLGRDQNFFMDGGTMVRPDRREDVEGNLAGIISALVQQQADLYLLQEVDENAHRSYYINEVDSLRRGLALSTALAYNFRCAFVPFPWPMIGKVESGLVTLSRLQVAEATRESLPVPFSWPVRIANLKRCLLVERIPLAGSDKELVMINLHLEAYDDGEGKRAQTEQLMGIVQAEYRKGNYVVAGGDFNQNFPNVEGYPQLKEEYWRPGQLSESDLPRGFSFATDPSVPTCRSTHESYTGDRANSQFYVIDGYIVSPNVKVHNVQTIDLNFQHSDHQPVRLEFTLQPEGAEA